MNDLKNGWANIDEFAGIPGIGITSVEKFKQGRSISIAGKVRGIFVRDFIFKSLAFLFIILTMVFSRNYPGIRLINAILGVLWIIFTLLVLNFTGNSKIVQIRQDRPAIISPPCSPSLPEGSPIRR